MSVQGHDVASTLCKRDIPAGRGRGARGVHMSEGIFSDVATRSRFLTSVCVCVSRQKTCLCNFDPLNPNFMFLYSKTRIYRDIHYFSYFRSETDCGYALEPPRRGGSNEYQQSMF